MDVLGYASEWICFQFEGKMYATPEHYFIRTFPCGIVPCASV